jgi:hypothetical protein
MIEIQKNVEDGDYVNATMYAEDIINMIVSNETTYERQGFICVNVIPAVCAKVTKKSRAKDEFQYGEDSSDDDVSTEVMAWVGKNLVSARAKSFTNVGTIDDVVENPQKNQITKKFNEAWIEQQIDAGREIVTARKKNPASYSYRHLNRIGILNEIKNGKNLPLTVTVRVRGRNTSW